MPALSRRDGKPVLDFLECVKAATAEAGIPEHEDLQNEAQAPSKNSVWNLINDVSPQRSKML
jgi:hypothetical protein